MNLKIYKLYEDATYPEYGTSQAACFDLCAYISYQKIIKAYSKNNGLYEIIAAQDHENKNYIDIPAEWRVLIPTGLILDIPQNHSVRVYPRSGLSSKKGLNLINCVGIIDADYVEEIFIPVYNNSQERLRIYSGERIAQAEMIYNQRSILEYIYERPEQKGDRTGGFGSTGV
jgi:dUTP pyrophosphatase